MDWALIQPWAARGQAAERRDRDKRAPRQRREGDAARERGERPGASASLKIQEQNRILVLTNKDILRALGRLTTGRWPALTQLTPPRPDPSTTPTHPHPHAHAHERTQAQARTRARHTNVSSQCKDEGTTSIRRPAWLGLSKG